jgi:hypothetical protein
VATLLDRDPAAHVSLDDPDKVAALLGALGEAGADGQVAALAHRAAAQASLDEPYKVAGLLGALRAAGATGQIATLLDRDPAAHVSLDDPGGGELRVAASFERFGVAELLEALGEVGAGGQAAALIERLPAAGQFDLFRSQEGHEEQFRFGRRADGRPAGPWAWTDLG